MPDLLGLFGLGGEQDLPDPPSPADPKEAARWAHTRLRRRMLDGKWKRDLEQRVRVHIGSTKADAWRVLDLSGNLFKNIATELAVLYEETPEIRHREEDSSAFEAFAGPEGVLQESGLWAQMPRFQRWTIGCREYLMRVGASESGDLRFRPVPPDLVLACANADTPDVPNMVMEIRLRERPSPRGGIDKLWTWDWLDIRDPDNPQYRVLEAPMSMSESRMPKDLSLEFLGGDFSGGNYPFRKADGMPILPYVLYHAERRGDALWDGFEGIEAVEGALNVGLCRTHWLHVLKDSSWPQRWIFGGTFAGMGVEGEQGEQRTEIMADPAIILQLVPLEDGGEKFSAGQWQPGGDVEAILRAIVSYAEGIAHEAGLSPGNLRRASADPRSGFALSLDEEGKRKAQKKFVRSFRDGDRRLLATAAILHNRATGGSLPESGYRTIHAPIPLSPQELEARRKHLLELLEEGLIGPIEAYRKLKPGITREEARKDLLGFASDRAALLEAAPAGDPVAEGAAEGTETGEIVEEGGSAETIEDLALNGAQIQSIVDIVSKVASGEIPRSSGVSILTEAFVQIDAIKAEQIIGEAGRGFTPSMQS